MSSPSPSSLSSSRPHRAGLALACAAGLAGALGCGGGSDEPAGPTVAFELDGALAATTFYDFPFPSDLRLTADGKLDLAGFPNDRNLPVLNALLSGAALHTGASVSPISYFRFTAPTPTYSVADMINDVIPADPDSPAWILDVDPDSDARGTLYPSMAVSFAVDDFAPANLVAVATRPGIVLHPETTYAVVLTRDFAPEHVPPKGFADLAAGRTPAGARGAAAAALYQPLWDTLPMIGKTVDDLLVATVFTTGDVVAELRERSELVRDAYDAELGVIAVDAADGDEHELFCELRGTVTMPVLQRGEAPYNTQGDYEYEADGTPVSQGTATFPISITLPNQEMPAGGWPLVLYIHGSGGGSRDLVDEGPTGTTGQGPGSVLARYGIAGASMAMPVQAERYPGATATEYLNLSNLAAFPFTFQTGVYESRLLLDELVQLEIDPATVATCASLSLPGGEPVHRFNDAKLMGAGHSMGGMYTNLLGAIEERWGALVPLGAGGFWNQMILITDIIDNTPGLLGAVFGSEPEALSFAYPPLALLGTAWEIAEPGAFVPRLAERPLPGIPVHDIYTPVGINDIYFPNPVYDSIHLALGSQQAGTEVWPEMQQVMALGGWDGLASYPVSGNRMGPDGQPHTRVVVQFPEVGVDSHQIYRTNQAVMRQYGCFLRTYLDDGIATVPDEGTLDDPCQ